MALMESSFQITAGELKKVAAQRLTVFRKWSGQSMGEFRCLSTEASGEAPTSSRLSLSARARYSSGALTFGGCLLSDNQELNAFLRFCATNWIWLCVSAEHAH